MDLQYFIQYNGVGVMDGPYTFSEICSLIAGFEEPGSYIRIEVEAI